MKIEINQLVEGSCFTICEVVVNGRLLVRKYMDSLTPEDFRGIIGRIEWIAEKGDPKNEKKFRHLEDKIFEIKYNKVRIFCFYCDRRLILLTHGVKKQKRKTDREDIERAQRIRSIFLNSRGRR